MFATFEPAPASEPQGGAGASQAAAGGVGTCNGVGGECAACSAGEKRACFDGAEALKGVGVCKEGEQRCEGGTWTACSGQGPAEEQCDVANLDEDCDGLANEGCAGGIWTGPSDACAKMTDGTLRCWGLSFGGVVDPGLTDVSAVALGEGHRCAIGREGGGSRGVYCWGDNAFGQCGQTVLEPVLGPAFVFSLPGDVLDVSVGSAHSCAWTGAGELFCWGDGREGELGPNGPSLQGPPGDPRFSSVPVTIPFGASVLEAAAGEHFSCARNLGILQCWGSNDLGQLGTGDSTGNPKPELEMVALGGAPLAIRVGKRSACALLLETIVCWGAGDGGTLGNGTLTASQTTPVSVSTLAGADMLAVKGEQAFALVDNELWGWGTGKVVGTNVKTPKKLGTFVVGIEALSAGANHVCVLQAGKVKCRGPKALLGPTATKDSLDVFVDVEVTP